MTKEKNDPIENKIAGDGAFSWPDHIQLPPGITVPFPWVHVRGNRVFISGHIPIKTKMVSLAAPRGKVGQEVDS